MPKTNEELYEEAERQLIGEAIAETEQEIHDSAFDNAPDDNDGDTSLEEMDPDDVVDDDIEETEEEDDLPEEGEGGYDDEPQPEKPEPAQQRGIPPGRLREEAEARRAAEARERELKSQLDQLQGRLDQFERNQRQPQQQQPPQQQGPDMFADPEGWAAAERSRIMQEIRSQQVNASLADAAEQHGDKFQEAFRAATSLNTADPANQAAIARIWNAPNPGRELMKWHQQETLRRDMGNDPQAYVDRLIQERMSSPEFRQQFMSGMRQEASGNQRTQVRLPPSLNGATGGTSHRGRDPGSSRDTARTSRSVEDEIFRAAWDD